MLGIVSVLLVMAKLTDSIASGYFLDGCGTWFGRYRLAGFAVIPTIRKLGMVGIYTSSVWLYCHPPLLRWLSVVTFSLVATIYIYIYIYIYICIVCIGVVRIAVFILSDENLVDANVPHVSPNKSVEGLLVDLPRVRLVIGVSLVVKRLVSAGYWRVLLLSLFTIIMSVFGDLFESMLKRHAGRKMPGHCCPGHGVFLIVLIAAFSRANFCVGVLGDEILWFNLRLDWVYFSKNFHICLILICSIPIYPISICLIH